VSGALEGQTALVTGGGRGIGRAVALAFAREGARVAVAARGEGEIESVARECGGLAVPLDVTDEAACRRAVGRCLEAWGRLDVLVNNAGIATSQKFLELDLETWRRVLAVDLDGPFLVTRAALPAMLERGSGAVIAIASVASRVGAPYVAAYTAAKHGLLGLMRSLAAEHARSGVTFNCVCPAYVDTPMTERTIENIVGRTGRTREEALRALLTPQGRLVAPEEVAAVCVLLASPAGRGINGQAIGVDGGQVQA
jgi:NAD(P)-dependent dehydrogenase (short-subunit alcohol dehydrogenase family)